MRAVGVVDVAWFVALAVLAVAWWRSARGPATARPPAPRRPRAGSLGAVLDPGANGLNAVRLALAAAVLVWHSYPLTGRDLRAGPVSAQVAHLLADGPVDGFFAISGFLIAGSWVRRPDVASFLRSRVLRLGPAYLVCLVVTAAVIAPLGIALGGGSPAPLPYAASALRYVGANASLAIFQWDIAGTPAGVPHPAAWNGSLWTLQWEAACYVGVLVLGVLGLLRGRAAAVAVFLLATGASVLVSVGVLHGPGATEAARLATMFAAGVLLFVLRDVVPASRALVAAAGAGVLACLWLPDYRVPGALLLAYALLAGGAMIRSPRWHLRTDVSYGVYIYAFPVQQLLALTALVRAPLPLYVAVAAVLTLGLALASWHLVERRALRHRHGIRATVPPAPEGGGRTTAQGPALAGGASVRPEPEPKPQASIRHSR